MSILSDCKYVDISEFFGCNLILDEEDVTEPQAIDNRNCMFPESGFAPRSGFTRVWNPNKILRVMYNWIQQQYNRLIYLNSDNDVVSRDISGSIPEFTIISSVTAAGMTFVQAGFRLYMSFFDSAGVSAGNVKVWDGTFTSAVPNVDNAFQPTLQTSNLAAGSGGLGPGTWGTFTETGTGSVSAGTHFYALVPATWNGFQTKPGPENSGVFTPQSFTSTGSKQVTIVVAPSPTWPQWVNTVQIAMTTADNPSRRFLVPSTDGGGPLTVPRGASGTVTFVIDIDDVTLTGGGPTEITDTLFNLFTGALAVHAVGAYNNRTIYMFRTLGPDGLSVVASMFASEPNKPQYVIPAENILSLPELRDITNGFALGGVWFTVGPSWTYGFTDNLRTPVNWTPPRLVSIAIGSPFIRGVSANQDKGYAWVADRTGLYYFTGGTYPILPTSYEQTPAWNRINFAAPANALVVKEAPEQRLVIVKAPLDGATVATHLLVWDYTRGVTPEEVKYCGLWNLSEYPNIGDLEIVQSYPQKRKEVWISRGDTNGDVKRLKSFEAGDATSDNPAPLFDDDGVGIDWMYKLIAVSAVAEGPAQQLGIMTRLRGGGQINITAFPLDQTYSIPLPPITSDENSMTPGIRFLRLVDMQSGAAIYQFDNGAQAQAFAYVAAIRAYYQPWEMEFQ